MFCKYKDALGKPREGVHSYRVLGVAAFDVIATVVGAYVVSKYTEFSFWQVLLALFISGIVLHRLFCVRTTVDTLIFPSTR
jgi:hypothetical protein